MGGDRAKFQFERAKVSRIEHCSLRYVSVSFLSANFKLLLWLYVHCLSSPASRLEWIWLVLGRTSAVSSIRVMSRFVPRSNAEYRSDKF